MMRSARLQLILVTGSETAKTVIAIVTVTLTEITFACSYPANPAIATLRLPSSLSSSFHPLCPDPIWPLCMHCRRASRTSVS